MNIPRFSRLGAIIGALAIAVSSASSFAQAAEEPQVLDSIKYLERADGGGELMTGVTTFKKGDQEVDLVGVIHIGDADYYNKMNHLLSEYDVVLYEMVGGPVDQRDLSQKQEMAAMQLFQRIVQSVLGLRYQLDAIDYDKENFVHADATWEQWEELMNARNESLMTFFQKAMEMEDSAEMQAHYADLGAEELMSELGAAILEFNPDKFKRAVAPLLAEAETMVTIMEEKEESVIITERNKIVMKAIDKQVDAGVKRIGVFYGAGHNPDFAERLAAAGFTEGDTKWMTAWDISNRSEPMDGLEVVETLLKDDYVIESIFDFFRELQDSTTTQSAPVEPKGEPLPEPAQ